MFSCNCMILNKQAVHTLQLLSLRNLSFVLKTYTLMNSKTALRVINSFSTLVLSQLRIRHELCLILELFSTYPMEYNKTHT